MLPFNRRCLLAFLLLGTAHTFAQSPGKPVPVIFDTDMGPDYDDVGAITLLHAFASQGKARILATIASTKYEGVGAVLSVLNTYFKRPDIPIAVPRGDALALRDSQHWSDTLIARYPHAIRHNHETPDAVTLYRKVLAAQPDSSVTIITVGFLTNISNLLQSGADTYSPLSGIELVKQKVTHMVSMAGKFPEGAEFNLYKDIEASRYVVTHFPRPVLFSGFEIGNRIKTGLPLIHNASIRNSPVKDVFRISIPMVTADRDGRMSWDQTAVLVAILGVAPYYTETYGAMIVHEDGSNSWKTKGRQHSYLVEARPVEEVKQIIDTLMMHVP